MILKRDIWLKRQFASIRDSNLFFLKIYGFKLNLINKGIKEINNFSKNIYLEK
ncbi:hypothetical protein CBB2_3434 [Clostridium botulinum]|nr:hypothetical protein CBB2_3434 [Clostridium botulinum]